MTNMGQVIHKRAAEAFLNRDKEAFALHSKRFLQMLEDVDELLRTRPEFNFDRWLTSARSWGDTEEEKNLLEYDQVMNEQREIIYEERRRVLDGESMRDAIYKMITDIAENAVDISIGDDTDFDEWNLEELNTLLLPTIPLKPVNRGRIHTPAGRYPQVEEGRRRHP